METKRKSKKALAYDSRAKIAAELSVKAFMLYVCMLHFLDTNWDLDGNEADNRSSCIHFLVINISGYKYFDLHVYISIRVGHALYALRSVSPSLWAHMWAGPGPLIWPNFGSSKIASWKRVLFQRHDFTRMLRGVTCSKWEAMKTQINTPWGNPEADKGYDGSSVLVQSGRQV